MAVPLGRAAAVLLALCCAGAALAESLRLEVIEARVAVEPKFGTEVVIVKISPASAEAFADFTRRNVGRKVALRIDGKVFATPVIREPILGGEVQFIVPRGENGLPLAARLARGKARLEVEIVDD